ncbi:hypothetical protein BRE01_62690 [Brevibacillus reuszeri]|uniref:Uncharacterized protein n=1 Tax=Brevibacillus reuszeri TaxID=54915 RepID=A0A0K9YWF3_9BACL|nr:hypothetical protein [Brevibacillus reuszeri]KNB72952.1 hypothetical protein ADS79_14105 [Brevibacillus reuszeri]GED72567.1 hypothetical protein BRE01_62690 [Brevibacillus reuszeri]
MKKYLISSLIFVLIVTSGILADHFSLIATIFGLDVGKFFNENKPHAQIYYLGIMVILFLIFIIKLQRDDNSSLKGKILEIESVKPPISNRDKKLLDEFFQKFDSFYEFKERLLQTRSMFIGLADSYADNITKFSEPNKAFSDNKLEEAKRSFLEALDRYIHFTDDYFNPIGSPNLIKFHGGTSEREAMATGQYDIDFEKYKVVVGEVIDTWAEFNTVLKQEYPDYVPE